jgi:hypothetical protein
LSKDHQRADLDANAEQQSKTAEEHSAESNLHGAAIIDKNGREVPITESMIVEAFDKIEKSDKSQ